MGATSAKKRALVTGAAGFVGSAVCRELLNSGYQVTAFIRETSNRKALSGLPVEYVMVSAAN